MKDKLIKTIKFLAIVLFCYLVFLGCGFFAVKYGITNTKGVVDANDDKFQKNVKISDAISELEENEKQMDAMVSIEPEENKKQISDLGNAETEKKIEELKLIKKIKDENFCKLDAISKVSGLNAKNIFSVYQKTENDTLISKMILAVNLRLKEDLAYQNKITTCENIISEENKSLSAISETDFVGSNNIFSWVNEEEWQAIKSGIMKDKDVIIQVGNLVEIEPRLIVSALIVEQLRLFHSQRELFKKFFEPLKILGNATKISLGVMGVKEATAIETEKHLKDPTSPYYLGEKYENLLDINSEDPTQERFRRLTDDKNHYYAYLYGAVYLKEMLMQWERAGYSVKYRPEIIGTLFNVGFPQSKPNPDPKVGGSKITINDGAYSFGSLSYEFYYSGELIDEFPYVIEN